MGASKRLVEQIELAGHRAVDMAADDRGDAAAQRQGRQHDRGRRCYRIRDRLREEQRDANERRRRPRTRVSKPTPATQRGTRGGGAIAGTCSRARRVVQIEQRIHHVELITKKTVETRRHGAHGEILSRPMLGVLIVYRGEYLPRAGGGLGLRAELAFEAEVVNVYDSTAQTRPKPISFTDMIGQPVWLDFRQLVLRP